MSDTKIDHEFLSAVLHPGRIAVHASDFTTLRRFVVGLSSSHSDGATDPSVSFEDRDARHALAQAVKASPASSERTDGIDGEAIMASRLFKEPATNRNMARLASYLHDDDKSMLSSLYAQAEANGGNLEEVDKAAQALGALRMSEALLKSQTALLQSPAEGAVQSAFVPSTPA
jgi:hypothetical protein